MTAKNKPFRPSKFTLWVIKKIFRDEEDAKLGDFIEVYSYMIEDRGQLLARLLFWSYLFRSIPKHFKNSSSIAIMMFNNYLKISLRNLLKHKGYAFICISGLVVGLTAFILISLFVQYEFSYDKYHPQSDRIYRIINHQPEKNYLNSDYFAWTQGPLAPTLMERYPEVLSAARLADAGNVLLSYGDKSFFENIIYFADQELFKIFSLKMLKGDIQTGLSEPLSIMLSEGKANKYFGTEDPIGKVIHFQNSRHLVVTGVFEDMPHNTHLRMEFIAPFVLYTEIHPLNTGTWTPGWYCYTYCRLEEWADPKSLENKLIPLSKEVFKKNRIESRLSLQPLQKIHLYSQINGEISANGNIKFVYLYSAIAFLILLIACVNYINLETARSAQKGREVGIRKVIGAQKHQLIKQLLGESLVFTFFAFFLALLVVRIVLPTFNTFFERNITFDLLTGTNFMFFLFALLLLTGLISGGYPAFLISSFNPISAIRGALGYRGKKIILRYVLVVFQFSISVILIISTQVVWSQLKFIQNRDVGYDKNQIVCISLRDRTARANLAMLKTTLLQDPHILAASGSTALPNNIMQFNRFPQPGLPDAPLLTLYIGQIDYDYIELYGLKVIQGRNFTKAFPSDAQDAVLINRTAARALGWEQPVGRHLEHRGGRKQQIIGVLEDFHFHSLHNDISPLVFSLVEPNRNRYLSIKINGSNIPETLQFIESRLKAVSPDYPFEYSFIDDMFKQAYRSEQKMGRLFCACAGIGIFIACLGLFGLVAFTAEKRTKEIGIRKVMGASILSIIRLLSQQFLKWVLLANIVAWPIAYYVMSRWLQNFAFHTELKLSIFAATALLTMIIALLTLSYQSIKAAAADPVNVLRYE